MKQDSVIHLNLPTFVTHKVYKNNLLSVCVLISFPVFHQSLIRGFRGELKHDCLYIFNQGQK